MTAFPNHGADSCARPQILGSPPLQYRIDGIGRCEKCIKLLLDAGNRVDTTGATRGPVRRPRGRWRRQPVNVHPAQAGIQAFKVFTLFRTPAFAGTALTQKLRPVGMSLQVRVSWRNSCREFPSSGPDAPGRFRLFRCPRGFVMSPPFCDCPVTVARQVYKLPPASGSISPARFRHNCK